MTSKVSPSKAGDSWPSVNSDCPLVVNPCFGDPFAKSDCPLVVAQGFGVPFAKSEGWKLPGSVFNPRARTPEIGRTFSGEIRIAQINERFMGGRSVIPVGFPITLLVIAPKGKDVSIAGILGISHANVPNVNKKVGPETNRNRMIRPKSQLILLLVSQTRTGGKGGAWHRRLKLSRN